MTRDPRTDPQPGDVLRGTHGVKRRVRQREGDWLFVGESRTRYRMRLAVWQEWCERRAAEAVMVANQEE